MRRKAPPEPRKEEPPEPHLDSGYAWLILVVMFLLNSSIGGSTRVYGLLYAKQVALGYYTHEEASWPVTTTSAVENLAGILTPALAQVLSWRQIELLSAALMVLSNLAAYFSDSLLVDTLSLGLLQGLALSMSSVLALAINNEFFERYRTTTFGIALSGSTCGVLYLEPLISRVLDAYEGFRAAYLALAAVFCGNMLLVLLIERRANVARSAFWGRLFGRPPVRSRKPSLLADALRSREASVAGIDLQCRTRRISSWAPPPTRPRTASSLCNPAPALGPVRKTSSVLGPRPNRPELQPAPQSRKPSGLTLYSIELADDSQVRQPRAQPLQQPQPLQPPQEPQEQTNSISELLCSPFLHCAWVMLALYYLVSRICILILVDFAADRGLDEGDARSLLNYWSLGELAGRILLASFIDLRWFSIKSCVVLTCLTLGATIGLLVAVETLAAYALCATLTAALISLEYVLINALIIEYMGQAKVTSCYSLASFICSVVLFARPAVIGFFRDRLGSYDGLLLCLAALTLAYALLFWLLEPLFRRMAGKAITGSEADLQAATGGAGQSGEAAAEVGCT